MGDANDIIKILEIQLLKTKEDTFDVDSWKKYNFQLLKRLFGSLDERLKQIENIDSEYNSWSLRDASGNESYNEKTKREAAEIIQSAIDELKLFGLGSNLADDTAENLKSIILDELKGSQTKLIHSILKEELSGEEKKRRISEIIDNIDNEAKSLIITKILFELIPNNKA